MADRSCSSDAVEQSNFYDYTVTRTDNLPDIHVGLIATDIDPTDVGQMPVPVVAPAISNAGWISPPRGRSEYLLDALARLQVDDAAERVLFVLGVQFGSIRCDLDPMRFIGAGLNYVLDAAGGTVDLKHNLAVFVDAGQLSPLGRYGKVRK
jgi:hypothetical protein